MTPTLIVQTKRIAREGSWVLLGQVFGVAGSLVAVKVLTSLLDPATYGQLALAMTVATLVIQCVLGPLANGATRFYAPAQEKSEVRAYLDAVGSLALWAVSTVGIITLVILAGLKVSGSSGLAGLVVAAAVFAVLSGLNALLSGVQSAARHRVIVAIHQGMEPWLRFLCAALLISWIGPRSLWALVGSGMAVLVVLTSQYAFFYYLISKSAIGTGSVLAWRRSVWTFSWPFSLWGLFTWAQLASDRWALEMFATTQDVGTYAVLFQLGYQPISLAIGMVMQLLTPIFYQRVGDGTDAARKAKIVRASWRLAFLGLAVSAAGFLVAELLHTQVFRLLVAPEYARVSYLLPWMVLASGVFAAAQFMALNLMSQMKTHSMVVVKILTAILGVSLNLVGAQMWGTSGVVAAAVIFSLSYFLSLSVVSTREQIAEARRSAL